MATDFRQNLFGMLVFRNKLEYFSYECYDFKILNGKFVSKVCKIDKDWSRNTRDCEVTI